jgi:hypothetical protein
MLPDEAVCRRAFGADCDRSPTTASGVGPEQVVGQLGTFFDPS